MTSLAIICIALFQLVVLLLAMGSDVDPTEGFVSLPFNTSFYHIQKPYDKRVYQRYSFINGVHKLWVLANDKPHTTTSKTKPRTEIATLGYWYSSGVWQFQGDAYVPEGTSGVCIMQVFGANAPYATTLMLRVYNGSLMHYKFSAPVPYIYDRWFRVNVIHGVDLDKVMVYIDGELKLNVKGRVGTSHMFKCGVYAQDGDSACMESRWKYIKILRQD